MGGGGGGGGAAMSILQAIVVLNYTLDMWEFLFPIGLCPLLKL